MAFQMTTWFSLPPSSPSKRAHTPRVEDWILVGKFLVSGPRGNQERVGGPGFIVWDSEDGWSVFWKTIRGAADGRFQGIRVIFFGFERDGRKWFKRTCFWGWQGWLAGWKIDISKSRKLLSFGFSVVIFLRFVVVPPFSKNSEKKILVKL